MNPLFLFYKIRMTLLLALSLSFPTHAQTAQGHRETSNPSELSPEIEQIQRDSKRNLSARKELKTAVAEVRLEDLSRGWVSADQYWHFLIDPEVSYVQKLAATDLGYEWFDLTQIAKLFAAMEVVRQISQVVKPPPGFIDKAGGKINFYLPDLVLGYAWEKPSKKVDYPLSIQAYEDAPYPWQMKNVLERLIGNVEKRLAHKNHAQTWLEATLAMPTRTRDELQSFLDATHWIAKHPPQQDLLPFYQAVLMRRYTLIPKNIKYFVHGNDVFSQELLRHWESPEKTWLGCTFFLSLYRDPWLSSSHHFFESIFQSFDLNPPASLLLVVLAHPVDSFGNSGKNSIPWAEKLLQYLGVSPGELQQLEASTGDKQAYESALFSRLNAFKPGLEERARLEEPFLDWAKAILTEHDWIPFPAIE